jgi:hypothetical protein
MNKLKNNIIKVLFGILMVNSFSSCDEGGDPNPGGTRTEQFAGDWYINISDASGLLAEHVHHYTYNTSADDSTMWIDDHGDGYAIKCKMTVDVTNGTFTSVAQPNLATTYDASKPTTAANNPVYATDTVTITEGKIEKGAAESKGGHKVDKISFKAYFSYDPAGTIITYDGHKRTGFKEDEY